MARRAVKDACAKAREVQLVQQPVMAAIGAGLPIAEPVRQPHRGHRGRDYGCRSDLACADIADHDVLLTGGGALLKNLNPRITNEMNRGCPVLIADVPLLSVI